jgi:hypothetical protein
MYRLQKLEEQQAALGYDTPPQISLEIEDLKAEIRGSKTIRKSCLVRKSKSKPKVQIIWIDDHVSSLSADLQNAAIQAFAAVAGISPQEIAMYHRIR